MRWLGGHGSALLPLHCQATQGRQPPLSATSLCTKETTMASYGSGRVQQLRARCLHVVWLPGILCSVQLQCILQGCRQWREHCCSTCTVAPCALHQFVCKERVVAVLWAKAGDWRFTTQPEGYRGPLIAALNDAVMILGVQACCSQSAVGPRSVPVLCGASGDPWVATGRHNKQAARCSQSAVGPQSVPVLCGASGDPPCVGT